MLTAPTYSGKSTLLMALLRLAPITNGSVTVNDFDVAALSGNAVRSLYNIIPQAPVFLPGNVRANLDPTSTHDDEKLTSILRSLHLWDVLACRGGLDADMDNTPLSQGQKQLFCIGRALVCNGDKRILLLDESTSSMDVQSERVAMRFISENFSGHTVVVIAHRLETIMGFDKIAVMDSGGLVEYDTPGNLLRREDGAFRMLWAHGVEHDSHSTM